MTLKDRIKNKIERSGGDVFMRSDFKRFGGYEQVGRALKALIDEKFWFAPATAFLLARRSRTFRKTYPKY